MLRKWLRAQIEKRNGDVDKIISLVQAENRDMTPEEDIQVKALTTQAASLKKQLDELPDTDPGEDPPVVGTTIRSGPPGNAPAAGSASADAKPYSLLRAVRLIADGRPLDGLEAEVDSEVRKRDIGRTYKGFAFPAGNDPEIRAMMYPGESAKKVAAMENRDLTTTVGTSTIFTEPRSFVDYLYAKSVVRKTGAEFITGMQGLFAIPRMTGVGQVYWLGEGISATPSNPTFDQIPFAPKLAIATVPITKQFVMQSSIDADTKVKNMLTSMMAVEADRVILNGLGTTQPLGLLNNTVIQNLSLGIQHGANGGPLSYTDTVHMMSQVASYNADMGKLAFVTNTVVRGSAMVIPIATAQTGASSYPMFIWKDGVEGDGSIRGYPTYITNNMPNNLVKGNASNCSAMIFGDWSMLTVCMWDVGVDVIVDPFTGKRAGTIEITMEMAMDSHPTREQSFAILSDITPT